MSNRLAIYVSSPDSYADVFEVFLKGYHKYWNKCPYSFYLTTNTQKYEGINCICNYKTNDSWVERTISALPLIESKFILLMCDDLIISDYVNDQNIEDILDYMDENNIRFCRLNPLPFGERIEGMQLRRVSKQTPYAINLQIGIFRKDFLVDLLGDGSMSAWDIENKINDFAASASDEFYSDVVAVTDYVISFVHGVYKGRWTRKALCELRQKNIHGDFIRGIVPFSLEVKIRFIDYIQWKLSPRNRRKLKSVLSYCGLKFVTNV